MEKDWRKSSGLFLTIAVKSQTSPELLRVPRWNCWHISGWDSGQVRILGQMHSKAKKLLITTETREVWIVRENNSAFHGYCGKCEADVEMVTLDTAVSVSRISGRRVIQHLVADGIHTLETANGYLRVCRNSLNNWLDETTTQAPRRR